MGIKYILFDLDGTLLPMDQDVFVKSYFKRLAAKLYGHGYTDSKALINGIWAGTHAMIANDGSCTNEEAFWKKFATIFGDKVYNDEPVFAEYYAADFQNVASDCGYTPKAKELVDAVRTMGYHMVLATNPIFPAIATQSRIRWAGLRPEDFEFYTTYENCHYCKPNPKYYLEILDKLGCRPEECLMVGNDVDEDMISETLGMKVFLLTDCIINKQNRDISAWPHGSFDELLAYIRTEC